MSKNLNSLTQVLSCGLHWNSAASVCVCVCVHISVGTLGSLELELEMVSLIRVQRTVGILNLYPISSTQGKFL